MTQALFLNAGNLWTHEYLDSVIELNELYKDVKVTSLFGSIAGLTPTARAFDRLPYLEWDQVDKYVAKALRNGIAIRYTLNQSCVGSIQDFKRDWDTKLRDDVKELHSIGVHEWTVTSPLVLSLLRDVFPDDFIEVSTIAEVSTPEEAQRWKRLGADGYNLSTSINRDFSVLGAIAYNVRATPSILVNEACLWKCPWRRECYNLSSHNSQRSEELFGFYPFRKCTEARLANPEEWVRSRLVLPQWMRVYQKRAGINWFKVAFRTHPIEVALPILKMYMCERWEGNLLELWPTITQLGHTDEPKDKDHISCKELDLAQFLDYFFHEGDACNEKCCSSCHYCERAYLNAKS